MSTSIVDVSVCSMQTIFEEIFSFGEICVRDARTGCSEMLPMERIPLRWRSLHPRSNHRRHFERAFLLKLIGNSL